MLRLFNIFGARLSRVQYVTRCLTTEAQENLEDMDRDKMKKILELEISVLQQEGRKAPRLEKLKPDHWNQILALPTKSARRKYYQFLWKNEMLVEARDVKKERKKIENEVRLSEQRETEANNNHISYGLNRNTFFLRVYDATITHWNNMKLIKSMMFDQKLIIDCSYDEYMNRIEGTNAGKQLMLSFAENRLHDEPFDLHFCNVDLKSDAGKTLYRGIPTLLDPDFPLHIHSESLTEKFDKKKLVYLTPHCKNELEEFNHDDIYVIGCMVDKQNNDPLSLAKAKKQGIRMAKLPLDKYLSWGSGSGKSLTLNQMVNILLEMKKHGDWEKALRFVPRRKIADYNRNSSFERRSYDRTNSYQQRQQFNDREEFQSQPKHFNSDRPRSFQPRQNFEDRGDDQSETRGYNNFKSRNYQQRQNYGNQQEFSSENRQPRSYEQRQSNDDRQSSSSEPQRFSYDRSRSYQQRQQFDNRQNFSSEQRQYNNDRSRLRTDLNDDEEFQPDRATFDKSRATKERKHFEKFNFNLDSWASKTNNKKPSDG